MRCNNCGLENQNGAFNCANCGSALPQQNNKKGIGKTIIIIICIVAILSMLCCCGLGAVIIKGMKDSPAIVDDLDLDTDYDYEDEDEDIGLDDDIFEDDEVDVDDITVDVEDSDDDILADAEDTDEDTDTVIDEDEDDIDRDFFDYMLIGNEDLGYANIPNTYIELTYDNIKEGTVAYQSPDEDETIIQIIPHSMSALDTSLGLAEKLAKSGADAKAEELGNGTLIYARNTGSEYELTMMYIVESPFDENECTVLAFEFKEDITENELFALTVIDSYTR